MQDDALILLLPSDEFDDCESITMEIRAGVGGSESALFAQDMFDMYSVFFSN